MDNNLFSERLKEARLTAKLKQTELAKISGVTAATISAYECADGKKGKNPSLDNALKLAQALNVSLDWLCGTSVSNERVQISDLFKMLVKIDDMLYVQIALDDIDFNTDVDKCLPNAFAMLYRRDGTPPNVAITFGNDVIVHFLSEWKKMRELYKNNTIDENLYNLWLTQQFQRIDEEQKNLQFYLEEDFPF